MNYYYLFILSFTPPVGLWILIIEVSIILIISLLLFVILPKLKRKKEKVKSEDNNSNETSILPYFKNIKSRCDIQCSFSDEKYIKQYQLERKIKKNDIRQSQPTSENVQLIEAIKSKPTEHGSELDKEIIKSGFDKSPYLVMNNDILEDSWDFDLVKCNTIEEYEKLCEFAHWEKWNNKIPATFKVRYSDLKFVGYQTPSSISEIMYKAAQIKTFSVFDFISDVKENGVGDKHWERVKRIYLDYKELEKSKKQNEKKEDE